MEELLSKLDRSFRGGSQSQPSKIKSASEELDSGRDDQQSPRYCESGKRKRDPFSLVAEVPLAEAGSNSDSSSSSSNTKCILSPYHKN